MKRGDLVRSIKFNSIGVIIEVFSDLDPKNPWVRVLFTHPKETYQWCRVNGLELVKKKNDD
jgi:hypothetical protein